MRLKYENATFRILVGPMVTVEISVHGCDNNQEQVLPKQLSDVGKTCIRLAQSIRRIKADVEKGYQQP